MSRISDVIQPFIFLVSPPLILGVIILLFKVGLLYQPPYGTAEFYRIAAPYLVIPFILSWFALAFGIYPVFIKTEKLFQRGYIKVVFEYQFLKAFLFIVIILIIGVTIYIRTFFPVDEFDVTLLGAFHFTLLFVTFGGILRFVTQVWKIEFRFYFAKAYCKIMAEKEQDSEKLRYLRLLLESYNNFLQRKLKVTINNLFGIYSIILFKDVQKRNQIINAVCESLNSDKMSLARYLSSLYKVPHSKFYSKESLFLQLKLPGTIVATAVPIIISIIQVITSLNNK